MTDLELEAGNTAEKVTSIVAVPGDLGDDQLMDFSGPNILEVKPGTTLLNGNHSNFGGLFAMGLGTGPGVFGVGAVGIRGKQPDGADGTGVLGEGEIGVHGKTPTSLSGVAVLGEGFVGVVGKSLPGGGQGVLGEGMVGVKGRGEDLGVVGEGLTGVRGRSTDTDPSNQDSIGVVGEGGFCGVKAMGDNTGVEASGLAGPGIRAYSSSDRGGRFTSLRRAQIQLVPHETQHPNGPTHGPTHPSRLEGKAEMGDMVVLKHVSEGEEEFAHASLWFCRRPGVGSAAEWEQLA
jgi:hypothetical protein